jgi:hypothetical protein
VTGPVPLAQATEPTRFGNKAAGLARVMARVPVPDGLVLPGRWLYESLDAQGRTELDGSLAAGLPATGCETLPRRAGFPSDWMAELAALVAGLGSSFAVRSSSADEDGRTVSFAGVFDTLVPVTVDQLPAAVSQVWWSGFGGPALSQYRRLGRLPAPDHLSVLVQRAIRPELAGVAFTDPAGGAYLEWVPGAGTELVDGRIPPLSCYLTDIRRPRPEWPDWQATLAAQLATLSDGGHRHDVEWAWDGRQLWIVQVRPATADLGSRTVAAGLRIAPLYEGDSPDLALGDCAADYARIRAKRRVPRAIALARGAGLPRGWLVNWDPTGAPAALRDWAAALPARLVLDAGPAARQRILDRDELADAVIGLAESRPFPFLCREYLPGDTALLSSQAADGSVYVEASADGLLALNRGFGQARPIGADQLTGLIGSDQAQALLATTREQARRLHPRTVSEWVVDGGRLLFVDCSVPAADPAAQQRLSSLGGGHLLSPGLARGRVQLLQIDDLLTEASTAPIISIAQPVPAAEGELLLGQLRDRLPLAGAGVIVAAARPIAVLSLLIGQVDGFLFEEGAVLSHLGILLREAGVPAAIVGTGNLPPTGSYVELVHGVVVPAD